MNPTVIEAIGYLGSALVLISFLMASVVKLRVVNAVGSTIFAVYALIIRSYPTALMNVCLVLINLHLEAYDDGEGKEAQARQLTALMQEEYAKGNYVIAGGDFNQRFTNIDQSAYPVYEGMWQPGVIDADTFGEGFSLLMDNTVPTCRSLDRPLAGAEKTGFQFYLIDGFIVSANVNAESVETLDYGFVCSDHNPVRMTFTLE